MQTGPADAGGLDLDRVGVRRGVRQTAEREHRFLVVLLGEDVGDVVEPVAADLVDVELA
ncbi:hypothetical protein [Streptomyces mirabilis]|uniref:hypothetical protein n=1 Tax=Streptomyces mirabilis TaxID=68239 RepID=UPI0036D8F870